MSWAINASKSVKSLIVKFLCMYAVWTLEINSGFKNDSVQTCEATHAIDFAHHSWCVFCSFRSLTSWWIFGLFLILFGSLLMGNATHFPVVVDLEGSWFDLMQTWGLDLFHGLFRWTGGGSNGLLGLLDCCDVVLFWHVPNNNKTEEGLKLFCIWILQDAWSKMECVVLS